MRKRKITLLRSAALVLSGIIVFMQGSSLATTEGNEPYFSGLKACAAAELHTLTVVTESEADMKLNVAGLARLPALLFVCEAFDAGKLTNDTEVAVSEKAAAVPGPTAFVRPNERIKAGALLKAAVMILAGDAITALAETAAGTPEAAAAAINDRLEQLGLTQRLSSLEDNTGSFSAKDLLILGKALANSSSFCELSGTFIDEIEHDNGEKTELVNQNRLLKTVSGCFGIATGSSGEAGYCGIFGVKRGDSAYLCVVIGASSAEERHSTAKALVEHAFAEYKSKVIVSAGDVVVKDHPISGGTQEKVDLIALEDAVILEKQGEVYSERLDIQETVRAPLVKTEAVGTLSVLNGKGEHVLRIRLFPAENVGKAVFFDRVQKIMRYWVHG